MVTEFYGLLRFLNHLQALGIHICIKDYVGFLAMNREFEQAFSDYLSHSSDFCMYIKSDKMLYTRCISMMNKLKNRFETVDQIICGSCHAGIKEYVAPLYHKGKLIGSVHAGIFPENNTIADSKIQKVCDLSKVIEKEEAMRLYKCNTAPLPIDTALLEIYLQLIANSVSLALNSVIEKAGVSEHRSETIILQNMIIADALIYIRQHFSENINVSDIAQFCHCSRSHLSHLFKTRIGVSIPIYINRLRIEYAKDLLSETNDAIMDIAVKVGFEDPNYFSRVFARLSGLTCSEYRKQFK